MKSRILVVDDNVNLTTLLAKTLSRFNYDIVVENDSSFAIDTTRRVRPQLILLDVMMPNRDGGEVLLELRNTPDLRQIPVILLTALAKEAQGLANQGGITSEVVSKPVELKKLLMIIEQNLDHSQSFTPHVEEQSTIFAAPIEEKVQAPAAPSPQLPDPKTASIRAGGAFGGLPLDQKPTKQPESVENPFSTAASVPENEEKSEVPTVFRSLMQAMGDSR